MEENRKSLFAFAVIFLSIFIWSNSIDAQQGRIVYDIMQSASLEGNLLNDPSDRSIVIYLPPNYDKDNNLYPVAYYLHGYTANHTMWLSSFGIHNVMDNLIKQSKIQDMIIVMPNGFNKYGGSFYANSSVAGNYEDYITKDLIEFVDNKYRTLPQRESRAIGGGSMGGYGAMKLAMKHPDLYCAIASHSGLVSLSYWKNTVRLNPNYLLGGYPLHRAFAIAFSPNPDNPSLYDYPADDKGNLIEDIWNRWLEHDPLSMVKTHQEDLRQLRGIYFDHGRSDSIVNVGEAQDFDKALTEEGIPHTYEEYSGGHTDQWTSRLYIALPFLSDLLEPEMLVEVEYRGKIAATWAYIRNR